MAGGKPVDIREMMVSFPDGPTLSSDNPAEFAALKDMALALTKKLRTTARATTPPPSREPYKYGSDQPFREAAAEWLTTLKQQTIPKTFQIKTKALTDFADFLNRPGSPNQLDAIYSHHCYDYVLYMTQRGISPATRANKLMYLGQFFEAMRKAGKYVRENPARGQVKYGAKDKRQAARVSGAQRFSISELREVFSPKTYPRNPPHAFWTPLVALFTGCRASEFCQTRVEDFKVVDDILCVLFTDEGTRQSLKNPSSRRLVPLHPKLRAMGLEHYIEDVRKVGGTYLFEYLGNSVNGMGDAAGKVFGHYIDKLDFDPQSGRLSLHSFRDTVLNEMKRKHVAPDKRHQFSGHADNTVESDHYTDEFEAVALAEFIHPVLDWDIKLPEPYQPGEFMPYWIKAQANAVSKERHQAAVVEREKRNGIRK